MINIRLLKNARLKHSEVSENKLYNFSSNYALSIYPINAVCTFIPKNACSTLRFSIAIANGFIRDINDVQWIHNNNGAFRSTQREASLASYTFVVLRCPYTRVASCFLDKIVDEIIFFNDEIGNKVNFNFHEFLLQIKSQQRSERDQHWRNQSDFLHYEKYDKYFSLELFSEAIASLGTHGLKVHDTRESINHNLSSLKAVDGDFSKMKAVEIKKMKEEGLTPNYKSMFSASEIELVNDIYIDDINLYKSHFGENDLLF
tara:strand:- start:167 stop:943 length:777 start_codon:yes stop_codon:yes gene_type:complete